MTPKELGKRLSKTLAALTNEVNDSFLCPRTSHYADRVYLGLLSKSMSLTRSVCHLVSVGYYGEAFGLTRSLVEAFLLIKFISNKDPEGRAKSYLDFYKAHVHNAEQIRKKHRLLHMKKPSKERMKWIRQAAKFPSTKVWQSAYNMAFEIYEDPREISAKTGKGYQAVLDYDGVYELTSHWVHCGSLSLMPSHLPHSGAPFKISEARWCDEEKGFIALLHAIACLFRVYVIVFRKFDKEPSALIHNQFFCLLNELSAEIVVLQEKTGRVKHSHLMKFSKKSIRSGDRLAASQRKSVRLTK
jgi:Family of unknown function (DUF5677)